MNIRSTREEPQYCILNKEGKEEGLLSGVTRKQAAEFYRAYYPGEKFYRRSGNIFKGFTYKEVCVDGF